MIWWIKDSAGLLISKIDENFNDIPKALPLDKSINKQPYLYFKFGNWSNIINYFFLLISP